MNTTILSDDFEDTVWELVQNELEEIETSASGRSDDPDVWSIGLAGDSVFAKRFIALTGESIQLLMQVTWTAIDQAMKHRRTKEFDPEISILRTDVLDPTAPIYMLDHPDDPVDPDYTLQAYVRDDQPYLAKDALDSVDDAQLFHDARN